jgi:PAS domain S-box-containing protein
MNNLMANDRKNQQSRLLAGVVPAAALLGFVLLVLLGTVMKPEATPRAAQEINLSAEERAWLNENTEQLTLLFNTEFPPIEFISESGTFTGLGADVISRVEELLEVEFIKIPSFDWNDHLAALKSGKCAIAPTIVRNIERESYAFFTTPYATAPVVIITTRDTRDRLSLEHLSGRRVGVVSGYATEKYLRDRALLGSFEVVTVENVPVGLKEVSFGQIDAFVENLAVAAYYIEEQGIPNLRVAATTDYSFAWSIGISREYPLLYSSVQKALDAIPENDLANIRKKWITLDANLGLAPETVLLFKLAAVFAVLLVAGLAVITFILKLRLKQQVAGLRQREKQLRLQSLVLDQIADHVTITDLEGVITYINQAEIKTFGRSSRELIGQRTQIYGEDDLQGASQKDILDKTLRDGHWRGEVVNYSADGARHIMDCRTQVVCDENGTPIALCGISTDITERKQAEEDLQRSEHRVRAVLESLPEGIIAADAQTRRFVFANESMCRMLGYSREELIGLTPADIHPADAMARLAVQFEQALHRQSEGMEDLAVKRKDGTLFPVELHNAFVELDGQPCLLGVFRDITQRRRAEEEREKLQAQLQQAQKMESIGRLAGGVAHDFNNMLGVILGYAELALDQSEPDQPLYNDLEEIRKAAERSADLTRQLLGFARKQTISPKVLDLNETVEGMLKMLRRLIGEDIDLAWLPGKNLWPIRMDTSQVDQILANLCVNARDAIGDTGKVTIETENVLFDKDYCVEHLGAVPGEYVMLAVSDDGCGMNEETMTHLFEPFFTTKEIGLGTGLGLATIYGIVKQNRGFINAYSEPDRGSTIKVYLPRHKSRTREKPQAEAAGQTEAGHETILLVEDEPAILQMTRQMLMHQGYQVLAASTPGEALRLAEKYSGRVQLLITDVVMPEMNGRDLARSLLSLYPDLKRLFMSGYSANVIAHHGVLDKEVYFIQKPFTMKNLAAKVRECLDQ